MSFGIIIPVYNSEKYIEKCIESVLKQTYKKFEIYLIDNKSNDNSFQLIKNYKKLKNIKIFENEENIGKYKSINNVLKKINTDYFLVLDSQDILFPSRLDEDYNIFQKNKSILVSQSKVKKTDESTGKIVVNNIYNYNSETYKTEIINKIGLFNENRFGGNLEFFLRAKKILGIDKINLVNKILTESILRKDKNNLCLIYSNSELLDFLKKTKKNHLNESNEYFLNNNKIINLEKKYNNKLDIEFYKKSYLDIQNLSDNEIIKHWNNIGIKENRLPNINLFRVEYPNFNFELYFEKNPFKINFSSNYEIYGWIFLKAIDNYYKWLKINGYVDINIINNETKNILTYNLENFINENNIKYVYISEKIQNEKIYKKMLQTYNLKKYNSQTDSYEKTIFYGLYTNNDFNLICTNSAINKYLLWSNNYDSFDDEVFENIFYKLQKYENIINLVIYPKIEKIFKIFDKSFVKINIENKSNNIKNINPSINKLNIYKKYFTNNLKNEIYLKNIICKNDCDLKNFINETDVTFTANWLKNKYTHKIIDHDKIPYIEKVIFILDFPNWGGGTTMFMNFIVSYFKNKINILILRQYEKLKLFLNDEYEIEFLSEKKLFDYISSIQNNIVKILFNHTIIHKKITIDFLVNLKKEITTLTHDYYLINKDPCVYLSSISNTYNNPEKFNINNSDIIVTQNIGNLYILQEHINDPVKSIIISELPDYKNKKDKIQTNNSNINIGIFGSISEIKGLNLLKDIINHFSNTNIKILIFGSINYPYEFQYPYKNISELNKLLIEHKPNILLETTLCPETYSYTLSLKMITDLPILYYKKTGFFTVEQRLTNYSKSFPFESLFELEKLINKHKQNYFYTIEEYIYFNNFWIEYFTKNIQDENINFNKKNIIMITSKIIVSNKKLNYINNRSIYSSEERFEQTIETIKSVKKYIPNTFVIIIDNSKFNDYKKDVLKNIVDLFINPINDTNLSYFTNESEYKGYGEIYQTKLILDKINDFILSKKITPINIFKITGRYLINDNFNYNDYDNEYNIFKLNMNVKDRQYYYTCFYKISNKNFTKYNTILNKLFNEIVIQKSNKYNDVDLEVFLPKELKEFININELGITQNISVWNDKTNI